MDFEFFDFIHSMRQTNAGFCCQNTWHDVEGYCLDAHRYLPGGSTLRLEPTQNMTIGAFCSTYWQMREDS